MNLKALADTLGMSKTTVSRALNGYPEVSEATRQRVLAAAAASGYRANPVARHLAVGRSNVLGILYPLLPADLGDPMFLDVVGGISGALEAAGMNFIIAPVSPANELPSYQQMVLGRRVDGLIVSRTLVDDPRIAFLSEAGFPFVAHGRTDASAHHAWFDYDNAAGIRLALDALMAQGHRRIALLGSPQTLNFARQRRDSFLDCFSRAGLAVDPRYLIESAIDRRSGYGAMQQLLACAERPTAVIVDNHLSGVGAVRALLDAGIQIGRDMSLVVWGRMADALAGLDVATIDQPDARAAGAKMGAMLLALLEGAPAASLQELWQPVLLPGASIGRRPD
ncbi:LacI family DNA-binding transcriptional regulator [Massilia dura]|uniref:LacI family DNA-binding transcriptional regulator n=1 Tax=Pseudoduganella dura TaxID=321982 RepID=A0A6I3XJ61_9BURK|nr:substrate-binding domain-containing protein [Pseudoduganella dura]MUI13232.1 LacI family DNA-binding transcriptional regulator [Pseudoduganella dura]GGX90785.1 LacI family transcriptional regulator [Pseudoduganella dura]